MLFPMFEKKNGHLIEVSFENDGPEEVVRKLGKLRQELQKLMDPLAQRFLERETAVSTLQRLTHDLETLPKSEERDFLLSEAIAQQVFMAWMSRDAESIARLSKRYLEEYPDSPGAYVNVVFPAVEALHELGRHDEELLRVFTAIESDKLTPYEKMKLLGVASGSHADLVFREKRTHLAINDFQLDELFGDLEISGRYEIRNEEELTSILPKCHKRYPGETNDSREKHLGG